MRDLRVDPSAQDDYTIRNAAGGGQAEVVDLLMRDARVNPSAQDDYAIKRTAE
jgi:hypothetical protein